MSDENMSANEDCAEKSHDHASISRRSFVGLMALGTTALVSGCAGAEPVAAPETKETDKSAAVEQEEEKPAVPAEPEKPAAVGGAKYDIVDNHLHYLDFIQKTDGVEQLVAKMDEAGVSQAVLFGMAMAKQWDEDSDNEPSYYLSNDSRTYYFSATDYIMMENLQAAAQEHRDRFLPFVCGINPNDKFAADKIRQILDIYPNQFVGIGELMSRHDDLTALTYGEPPHLDHPAFLEIFDLGAERGLPILIHHNITGSYMTDLIYLEELKAGLAHNRAANIIWAHVGISRRVEVENLPQITDELLLENENLYIDLSWVVFDDYINKDKASLETWAALIEKHPTRFMIGSDKVGHWDGYPETITRYYDLLDLLTADTATNLCKGNILSLVKRYD